MLFVVGEIEIECGAEEVHTALEALPSPDFVEGLDGLFMHTQGKYPLGAGVFGACAGDWANGDLALPGLAYLPH